MTGGDDPKTRSRLPTDTTYVTRVIIKYLQVTGLESPLRKQSGGLFLGRDADNSLDMSSVQKTKSYLPTSSA